MDYRENNHLAILDPIVDGEGKSAGQSATNVPVDDPVLFRHPIDYFEGFLDTP